MTKILNIAIFLILMFLGIGVNASFQPVKFTIYFENIETKKIKYFETITYTMKGTYEIALNLFIDKSIIGDRDLFSKWYIKEVCTYKECHNNGELFSGYSGLGSKQGLAEEKILFSNNKNNEDYEEFSYYDLSLVENINIIYSTLFSTIVLPFLFFLPINLIVFYCFGYLLYRILFKRYKIKAFKYIYLTSFFIYLVSTILLYYFGYAFINFSAMWFGFTVFFITVGIAKLVLLFISVDYIKIYNKEEIIKSEFGWYVIYFYSVIIILTTIYRNFDKYSF